ncbi:restriction endonuclease subunit S [Propionimicrobium lymphophilum]|uniref:restriction endonuclease subunit S n=1 Tax=Propionimicrobium lymphophilum TaxID=33012 RepID=UPI000420B57B|nr:restriction endonuclease subunit S [Propionimicrobium lymphophilum]
MIAEKLRQAVLQAAVSGQLTDQREEDGTAAELLEKIATERNALVKAGKLKKQKPLPVIADSEKRFGIPNTWSWARLSDLFGLIRGITFPSSEKSSIFLPGSERCLTTGSVQREYSELADVFVGSKYLKRDDLLLRQGDIVISTANSRALVGKSIFWNEEERATFGGFLTVARAYSPLVFSLRFGHYVIRQLFISGVFTNNATQTTNIANLSNKVLSLITVPVPPRAEQDRIVAKLDQAMPLIDRLAELERERERRSRPQARHGV